MVDSLRWVMRTGRFFALLLLLVSISAVAGADTARADPGHGDGERIEAAVPAAEETVGHGTTGALTSPVPEVTAEEAGHQEDAGGGRAAAASRTERLLVVGGEAFVEGLLTFLLAVLWLLLVALQLARPYVLQLVDKFSLRLGADLWWLAYVLIRDLLFVATFVLSFFFYYPMLLGERAFPITGSLAATLLFAVLVLKLTRDVDDDPAAFRLVTNLTATGAGLYLAAVILGVEASRLEAFETISPWLVTHTNPAWAFGLLWLSYAGLLALGTAAVRYVLATTRGAGLARRPARAGR
ncbi:hypothetical protein [Limnochorda pilosa]|uniref:Uncharacterized protein n=1 Tax=Limnochorda pilosa TaxID=1555112 RepID=A0A0K2SQK6_LIMPI|nr:hypothetical protein [Limnochorda pilosa]BAS29277.1 hypothetical protein LIP_3465 [Limnochorda pilosa]